MGQGDNQRTISMWVDANQPVVQVAVDGDREFEATVSLEPWRTERRAARAEELHSFYSLKDAGQPIYIEPDMVIDNGKDQLMWLHRNERSVYKHTMQLQGLESLLNDTPDPLLHRTFGGLVRAPGLKKESPTRLASAEKSKKLQLSVHLLTTKGATAAQWQEQIEAGADAIEKIDRTTAKKQHLAWWNNFWNTSWIRVSGGDQTTTDNISLGWHAHRYLMACAGRGRYPIKFNGSIFTVDGKAGRNAGTNEPTHWDADFRSWGDPYWFQNMRQVYWPMLAAGDFDLMQPFFQMYIDVLPLARKRTELYFDHEGAFFPETQLFYGAYANSNYGDDRTGKAIGEVKNNYIKRYWQGGLELSTMMLDYYHYTGNRAFLEKTALPIISEVITFFGQHWPTGADGKIEMYPAQALETYWDVKNPLPEIAGMKKVLQELQRLPHDLTTADQRSEWKKIAQSVPDLPIKKDEHNRDYLAVAGENYSKSNNKENVPLYSVFPYRLFGVGRDKLDLAKNSFTKKDFEEIYRCWHNDPVYAAHLGLTEQARTQLGSRFVYSGDHRYPAFYINGDWLPDHDNGGVAQQTVQAMLLQAVDDKLYLFPAWPKEWDVEFKLHAPKNTTIEVILRNGELEKLDITPKARRDDLIIFGNRP